MQLRQVDIGYTGKRGQHVVARAITVALAPSSLTALIGPNGTGKSTLLKTISGYIPPLDGDILLHGKPIQSYTHTDLAQLISVVLTERVDVPSMCVSELIALGRSPYTNFFGTLSEADYQKIEEAMNLVGISHLAGRPINTLSDGERQKAMIAKAIAQETPFIFLDEPTAFLDFPSKVETMLLLKHLATTQHKTILLSTHDLEIALQTADYLWALTDNGNCQPGTPKELAANGTLSAIFSKQHITFNTETLRFDVNTPSKP